MAIRALADRKFNRRNLLIAIVSIAIGLWGAYDALIAYPKKLKYAKEYAKLGNLDQPTRSAKWREITQRNEWSHEVPKSIDDVQGVIIFNYCLAVGGGLIGAFFLLKFFRMRSAWIEANEGKITTSWGQTFELDKVFKLNKVKWDKKGIAKVTYKDPSGNEKVMTIDDFKFLREPTGEILKLVEKGLKPEQIVLPFSDAEDDDEDDDVVENDAKGEGL